MTHSDMVLLYDKQQSDPATARVCPHHGTRLAVHASGAGLMCSVVIERSGLTKFKTCEYAEPTSSL